MHIYSPQLQPHICEGVIAAVVDDFFIINAEFTNERYDGLFNVSCDLLCLVTCDLLGSNGLSVFNR